MNIDAKSREEYFQKAEDRQDDLRALDAVIREAAPDLKPVLFGGMTGKMLGYGMQPYQTKSMKQAGEWPILALAAQKHHMSLYVCAVEDGQYIAEKLQPKLGKVSCGKSCIRFKKIDDLNLEVIREMLRDIDKRVSAGEKLFGM